MKGRHPVSKEDSRSLGIGSLLMTAGNRVSKWLCRVLACVGHTLMSACVYMRCVRVWVCAPVHTPQTGTLGSLRASFYLRMTRYNFPSFVVEIYPWVKWKVHYVQKVSVSASPAWIYLLLSAVVRITSWDSLTWDSFFNFCFKASHLKSVFLWN